MYTIRTFVDTDLPSLLDSWNAANTADPITADRFLRLVLADTNFDSDGLFVACQEGRVLGAAYAVVRRHAWAGADLQSDQGWLPFFFVSPSCQHAGLGKELVSRAMKWIKKQGATTVTFGAYTPNYIVPGIDKEAYPRAFGLLDSLGFKAVVEAVAMDRSLVDFRQSDNVLARKDALIQDGWRFEAITAGQVPQLVKLAGEHFNPDWARAIREAVAAGLPLESITVAVDPLGAIVGWAMHGTYELCTERFGPFGVLESQRGLGLGRILLEQNLQRMKAAGAHSAWFLWTGETTAAFSLYRSEGFTVTRRFSLMRAGLE